MKVKPSVKPICEKCKVIRRKGRVMAVSYTHLFVDRFFNVALPRVRDFRGINGNGFDGRGNFACGIDVYKRQIPSGTLILSVAAGVGLFLVFAFLRMLIGVALPKLQMCIRDRSASCC